jgi:peptidoglycan/xylan/chitin deacetylase (PgdA/CDA1 family)
MALATPARADTTVSLSFDGAQASQAQAQVQFLLASHGMKASFFVNSERVGTSGFYMTWQQVDELAADGHEIGGRTLTHVSLMDPDVLEAEKRRQVCEDRQNLIARGYDPVTFAYPGGWGDAVAESIVSDCGYDAGRRVGGVVSPGWCPNCGSPRAESLPPDDQLMVRTPAFGSGEITLAALQGVVTQAELAGGWLPIVFHGVCETECGPGWVQPSTLEAFMDWLAARSAQGTVVRTIRETLGLGAPPRIPPDTSISSGPSGSTASRAASFEFSATATGVSFDCKLDAADWAPCASPQAYSGLGDGSHTFAVRAKDSDGNVDQSPATRTWSVNTAAPETSIVSGPSGSTASRAASFEFSATESGATFECKLDAEDWAACTSPKDYLSLANGSHTFSVRAKNALGTVDDSPATRTWTVDAETIVSFTFDDGDATQYQVKDLLAGHGMRATFFVNSPRIGTGGFYMSWAQVDALAADGNEIAGHTLTHADLTDPALTEAQKRAQVCDDRQNLVARGYDPVSFAYPTGASDATAQSIVSDCGYRLGRRVGGIASPNWCPSCPTPAESLPPENPLVVRTPSFGSGEITLSAIQAAVTRAETTGGWLPLVFHGVCESGICGDGWVRPSTLSAVFDWLAARSANGTLVKTMRAAFTGEDHVPPPDTSITDGPTGTVASRNASFEFSSTGTGSTFECKLDAGAWEACSSPKSYASLADGPHTFSVRAKSGATVDPTPATRTWTVDATAPDTSITSGPSGAVNSSSASFAFSASQPGASFECKLDAGAWGACTSPKAYSLLSSGSHTFSVRAKDGLGNVDATPATRTWTVDTSAPGTSITSGPTGTVSSTAASFAFSSTESGVTFECKLDSGAWAACSSPKAYSGLSNGSHTFSVRAKDAAGNVDPTPATRTWTVDAVAPQTSITSGPGSSTWSSTATFRFSSSQSGSTFECKLDSGSWSACTSPKSYSVSRGTHTFSVRAKDAAGNVDPTPATYTWRRR